MLNSQENRLKAAIEQIKQQHEERLKNHAHNFEYEVTKIRVFAIKSHEFFVEQVKKVEDSINLKVAELKPEMTKKVENLESNYSLLHGKVDVIADSITKLVEYHTSFSTKFDAKLDQDSKVFRKLEEFLGSLKESMSKINLSKKSFVS
ncbi:unnamed protein product [Lactuca saligna]|uniref:Uncharacterized protein n=1 Tax=Lactuca saligna TaxID=75948 RepID=A0AA36E685_LACSI|nr:unnamed protein product [Lactuca saligna]